MNSSIVTKEQFYKLLGENKSYRKLNGVNLGIPYIYIALDSGYVFVYNYEEDSVLIPEKYEKSIDNLIKTTKISFEDWKIAKISSQVPYIRNEYIRNESLDESYEEGEYILENTRWNNKYQISIKTPDSYSSYVFSKEMKEFNLCSPSLNRLISFYNIILNEKGKNYKRSNN